jgi:DNA primase
MAAGSRPASPAEESRRDQARAQKLTALHDRLTEQVRALRSGEDWTRWLDVASRFHAYSFNNTLLILAQRPEATAVAGYRAWQSMQRQVDKGEKGIQILAPILSRAAHGDPSPAEDRSASPQRDHAVEPAQIRVTGYRVTYVWDVEQTSGKPLSARPRLAPLRGAAPDGLWDGLVNVSLERGFTVERGHCRGANGLTDFRGRTVRVRGDVDDAQAVKTLAHEIGHVLLHEPTAEDAVVSCRGITEVEAESVAYLVASVHGLSTDSYSFPYVTGWAGGVAGSTPEQVVTDTGQRALRAADYVLGRTDSRSPDGDEDRLVLDSVAERAQVGVQHTSQLQAYTERAAGAAREISGVRRAELLAMHTHATAFFEQQVNASWVPQYLADRGVADVLAASSPWRIGYAPPTWTALTDHLHAAGHSDAALEASGLATRARTGRLIDRFRDRAMLPIRDADGRVIAFIGRARPDADERVPRYLNSPQTTLYSKGNHLLGLSESATALKRGAVPVLVEGPFDAMALTSAGSHSLVGLAPCGTALTERHVAALVAQIGTTDRSVVVATDADAAGRAAACKAYELLNRTGLRTLSAGLPAGLDPAALLQERGRTAVVAACTERAYPLVDLVVDQKIATWADRLRWAEGRVGAVRSVAPIIAALPPDEAVRQTHRMAQRVGIGVDVVMSEVAERLAETHQDRPRGGAAERGQADRASTTPVRCLAMISPDPCAMASTPSTSTGRQQLTGIHSSRRR